MREIVVGGFGDLLGLLLLVVVVEMEVEVGEGASRSLSVPIRSRTRVEERAMTETCVAGEFDGGMEAEGG